MLEKINKYLILSCELIILIVIYSNLKKYRLSYIIIISIKLIKQTPILFIFYYNFLR